MNFFNELDGLLHNVYHSIIVLMDIFRSALMTYTI